MALLDRIQRRVLEAVTRLGNGNPFLPERVEAERQALGDAFVATTAVWHVEADLNGLNPNLPRLQALAEEMGTGLRDKLAGGAHASARELELYQRFVFYLLYSRHEAEWMQLVIRGSSGRSTTRPVASYRRFAEDVAYFFDLPERHFPEPTDPAFLFALGFQIRRAFHHTFRQIYGGSMPAARLRAAVWQSIFTHDAARYRRSLTACMGDVPTLIVGESGTGKELVARAIALSRFVPFDAESASFRDDYAGGFHGLNLSALSRTLLESELFGHRRGAFTGALEDRSGWLESCGASGSVFLDEIGELDPDVQVKLLRVLQTRSFQRIGEIDERRFEGKIIAATNRDLAEAMQRGAFRDDLYYRLCADCVRTPTLREQLDGEPAELRNLVSVLASRMVPADEVEPLTDEVVSYAEKSLGVAYSWPGNVRELEQCVRSILVRGSYDPAPRLAGGSARDWLDELRAGALSADEVLRRYCTQVYADVGSYEETARRLGLDRRTVKAKIDPDLLARLRG